MTLIDAHAHLWDADAFPLPWWRPELGLSRRVTAADLISARAGCDVSGQVLVQAAHTAQERQWLTAQAARLAAVVVGQCDPTASQYGDSARALPPAVRLSLRSEPAGWASLPLVRAVLDSCSTVELLCRPDQLLESAMIADSHPETMFVLDHLALGADEPDGTWYAGLDAFSGRSNTCAKVSGLLGPEADNERLACVVGAALEGFGADRLMFGSDWPMSARWMPYHAVVELTAAWTADLDAEDAEAFWRGTARRVYFTDDSR